MSFSFLFGGSNKNEDNPYVQKEEEDAAASSKQSKLSLFGLFDNTNDENTAIIHLKELNQNFLTCNLFIVIVVIIVYVFVGIGAYHSMLQWSFLDSMYFVVETVATIGYGDFVPNTDDEKMFTSFYILFGIGVTGILFSLVTAYVQDYEDRNRIERDVNIMLRIREERELLQRQTMASNLTGGISLASLNKDGPNTGTQTRSERYSDSSSIQSPFHDKKRTLSKGSGLVDMAMNFGRSMERRAKTLDELQEASILEYSGEIYRLQLTALFDFIGIFLILIFGMLCMAGIEDWSHLDAFYWATVTLTATGYGDLTPDSNDGKLFFIFYAILGTILLTKFITDFVRFPIVIRTLRHEKMFIDQFKPITTKVIDASGREVMKKTANLPPALLKSIFQPELDTLIPDLKRDPTEINKSEFILMFLQMMEKITEKDIFIANNIFEQLDMKRKGFLSMEDMEERMQEAVTRQKEEEKEGSRIRLEHQNTLLGALQDSSAAFRGSFTGSSPNLHAMTRKKMKKDKRSVDSTTGGAGGAAAVGGSTNSNPPALTRSVSYPNSQQRTTSDEFSTNYVPL